MGKGARRGSWVSLTSLACLLALTTSQPPPGKRLARVAERKAGPVVAAYVPDYRMAGIDWPGIAKHLTDIILFSVEISPAGDVIGLDRVQQGLGAAVAEKASNRDLRVLLCIGGAGRSEGFIFVSKKSAERKSFVQRLVMLCNERGLDGIDFDWEGVNFLEDRALLTAYTQLLIQTRKQFKKHGLIVSLAMHPGQEKYMIDQKLANAVDRIHFMAYDNCHRTPCQHSTLDESMGHVVSIKQAMLRYKSSPTKIVLGMPAYARLETKPHEVMTYADIAAQHPQLEAKHDRAKADGGGLWYFNGPATIKAKVVAARRQEIGGVFLWEAGQDLPPSSPRSLVLAMGNEARFGSLDKGYSEL